jgi:hypothetical protein
METDNTTATGYISGTIKQKRTEAMDMSFYLIKDRVKQVQINVYWGPVMNFITAHTINHVITKLMGQ